MRFSYVLTVAMVAAFVSASCDERLSELTGPTPELRPTFSSIQRDIFGAADSSGRPACTRCHTDAGGRRPSGGMLLRGDAAYASLVNVPSRDSPGAIRVIPGDPEHSYIIQKIEGRKGIVGDRMPMGGPFLTDGQILVIKRWIELGAPND
jgi:hypothetical protein